MSFKTLTTTDIKVLKLITRKKGATSTELKAVSKSFGTNLYKMRKRGLTVTVKRKSQYVHTYKSEIVNLDTSDISSPAEIMLNKWLKQSNVTISTNNEKKHVSERAKVKKTSPKKTPIEVVPPMPKVAKPSAKMKEIEVPVKVTVEVGRKKPTMWQKFVSWITG